MKPAIHLLLTIILFFILKIFFPLDLKILLVALSLTLIIDILDHGILILFARNPLAIEIKGLFLSGKISKVYRLYYRTRRENARQTFFHNFLFLFLMIFLVIWFRNLAIFLGIVFHLICDLFYEYYKYRTLSFVWTFGLMKK